MPKFSQVSLARLSTCDPRLIDICNLAIQEFDFTVLCGHRTQDMQDEVFNKGLSKVRWPNSKHNSWPSKAVDIAPYPIDWTNTERFGELAAVMQKCADKLGFKIRWGGTFKTLVDKPHFELSE